MTILQLLESARYDIRDTAKSDYTDPEIFEYFKRALSHLEESLSAIESDLVSSNDTITLSSGSNYISTPDNCIVVTEVWQGQNKLVPLTPMRKIYYERKVKSSNQAPYYWCEQGDTIQFDATADQDYDINVYFDKATDLSNLTMVSDVPYSPRFDNALRQAVILQCKHRNEFGVGEDGALLTFFKQVVLGKEFFKRNVPYHGRKLDF